MGDLLLPTTDGGAVAQVLVVNAITLTAAIALRHHPALRSFTTGLGVLALSLMTVRALH